MFKKFFFIIVFFILIFTQKLWPIDRNIVFLATQMGIQDTQKTAPGITKNDNYLTSLEESHGQLKENREVNPKVFSFDFYKINGNFSSGFGIEFHNYKKSFSFEKTNSSVDIYTVGLLYGLNFYYRGDFWFPFIGFGTGNFSAKVKEHLITEVSETNATVFGQVDKPFYYKFGIRIPINGLGILITKKYISANMNVNTGNKNLSLGGIGDFLGIYYIF